MNRIKFKPASKNAFCQFRTKPLNGINQGVQLLSVRFSINIPDSFRWTCIEFYHWIVWQSIVKKVERQFVTKPNMFCIIKIVNPHYGSICLTPFASGINTISKIITIDLDKRREYRNVLYEEIIIFNAGF